MAISEVSAAVLIGGRSQRMGTPKALMRLDTGGPTFLELAIVRLGAVASEVLLVGTPRRWELPPSLRGRETLADRGLSAADGLVIAIASAHHRFCIVTGCDMPFLDTGLLKEMIATASREGRGVLVTDAGGSHPLHAIYDRRQLPALIAAIAQGERSLGRLADGQGMATIDVSAAGRPDREPWSVFNVNTPADLDRARQRANQT